MRYREHRRRTGDIDSERWCLHYDHGLYLIGLSDLVRAETVLKPKSS
jgi:hypothetical protein